MSANKIYPLEQLADIIKAEASAGKRIVLCHGTFDLMHAGHIKHLQRAKQHGDILVVTVTADAYVNKGPGRPVFNEHIRAESLAALDCTNYVAINHAARAINVIEALSPDIYIKGNEYQAIDTDITGSIGAEKRAVEAQGGKVVFTDEVTFSSSELLNEYFGIFSNDTKDYLSRFHSRYSHNDIIDMLQTLKGLNVLVVGDAIIDEYHYTAPLGRTGKGNILAVKYESAEKFAGGSIAVANHISDFVENVTLLTSLGDEDSHEEFICEKLATNINPVFINRDDGPTVVKRRFVDSDMAKLFEVYLYNDRPLPPHTDEKLCQWISDHGHEYDAVIVADFGNGMLSQTAINALTSHAKFIAVNTQINSGNHGYRLVSDYSKADFISLNEPELRLATQNKHGDLELLAKTIAPKLDAANVAVTRGTKGLMMFNQAQNDFANVPALSTKVVDRIGAGDTFLALSSICLAGKLPFEVAAFVGSAAAALDVQIVCNRDSISSTLLQKYITTLLKWS